MGRRTVCFISHWFQVKMYAPVKGKTMEISKWNRPFNQKKDLKHVLKRVDVKMLEMPH